MVYFSVNTHVGGVFHYIAVRIIEEEAMQFVRMVGWSVPDFIVDRSFCRTVKLYLANEINEITILLSAL